LNVIKLFIKFSKYDNYKGNYLDGMAVDMADTSSGWNDE
jgi:hypothetical protein